MTTAQTEWAVVVAGVVTNVAVASSAVASARGWVGPITAVTPQPGIGWTYMDGTWTPPPPS